MACVKNPPFQIYDALGSAGKPTKTEMDALGIAEIAVVGVSHFEGHLESRLERLPRKKNMDYVLCVDARFGERVQDMCLDLEHWPVRDPTSHAKYLKVMQMAKSLRPLKRFGYFEILPNMRLADFANSQGLPGTPERIEYDQLTALRQPVADICDYIAPSLYSYWPDLETWKAFADLVIATAIQMANGKPVYPFLCPRYMPLANMGEAFVSGEMWRAQMEYLWTECDGIILWDYFGRPMNQADAWWQETIAFAGSMGGGL